MLYDVTWDIYAVADGRGATTLDNLPQGFSPPVVGTPEAVIEQVRHAAPHVEVVDLSWLRLDGGDHSIEISLGKAARVRDLTFFIHSGGGAVDVVHRVCRALGVIPYDTETGERLTETSQPPQPPPLDDEDDAPRKHSWWRR